MTTKTKSALEELDEHAREIDDAKKRLAELQDKKRSGKRDIDEAVRPLRAYHRSVEAGEIEPDPERERRLEDALKAAQAKVAPRAVYNPRAGLGDDKPLELVDPEIEGQLDGARERVRTAETEYARFRARRFDDLVVELGALGTEYVERYGLVAQHAARGAKEWRDLRRRWDPIVEVANFGWEDFPASPFAGVQLMPLMPKQLAEGGPVRGPARPVRRKQG